MAITQTQQLPAPFLQDVTKDYAKRLGATTAPALDTSKFAPTVAGQDPYQAEAYGRVPGGIGAYQPYITGAGAAGFAPGAAQMGETAATNTRRSSFLSYSSRSLFRTHRLRRLYVSVPTRCY